MSQTIGTIIANKGQHKMLKEGKSMQSEAQRAIDNFSYQPLDRTPSTLGADLMREENARIGATQIDALRSGGVRGVVGGLPSVMEYNNRLNSGIAANLDMQQAQIDAQNEQMTERRQAEELAGWGQMLNVGRGMQYKAYSDFYATASNQSQHIMDLWSTFGGGMGSSSGGAGGGQQMPSSGNFSQYGSQNLGNWSYGGMSTNAGF